MSDLFICRNLKCFFRKNCLRYYIYLENHPDKSDKESQDSLTKSSLSSTTPQVPDCFFLFHKSNIK